MWLCSMLSDIHDQQNSHTTLSCSERLHIVCDEENVIGQARAC